MADKEKSTISGNPLKVEFPRDTFQSTQELRAAGLRAAGRAAGHKDKVETLLATLKVLMAHTVARHKKAMEVNRLETEARKEAVARAKRENAIHDSRTEQEIEAVTARLEALKAQQAEEKAKQ